ncbi:MAG: L-seryl-tRNA(Sec) selenium transferase [Phycisphaerales bacterium]|nr:L-seryl-tRNA(Sec) selenium transferase [Phycisphaerales bacterium]
MSDRQTTSPAPSALAAGTSEALRSIPPIHRLVESLEAEGWSRRVPRAVMVEAARDAVERFRAGAAAARPLDARLVEERLLHEIAAQLEIEERPPLRRAINATGILLHTGLGRAPLAEAAVDALADVAGGYAPVELDLGTGGRGKRRSVVERLLVRLTGCEAAVVVNNNAAALLLVLATLSRGRRVIVSRGELIEIGGSFRLPEVIEAGGAILHEVGTTNKTRLSDYERAIDETTGAILKAHASNYRIEGFTAAVEIGELAALGRDRGLPVIHDIGSGALNAEESALLPAGEPEARSSIEAGADVVLFSGDKLLGGPQCGLIIGRRDLIDRIDANPLMRALRVDKYTLAALGATLQIHQDIVRVQRDLPVWRALGVSLDHLRARAGRLVEQLAAIDGVADVQIVPSTAYVGGGSVPAQAIESIAVQIAVEEVNPGELARRLRTGAITVVARIRDDALLCDLRSIFDDEDERFVEAIRAAIGPHAS